MLPTLALAQQAGQHITRPTKPATTTTTKPPKKQSGSTHVDTRPAMQNKTFTVGGVSFTMVAVEGGTFTMGATSEQYSSDAYNDALPVHSVTLSSYYIGQTEVTQELWQAVMGSNPSKFKGARRPVEQVSWNDCQTFVRKLNSLTGQNFKLPTEAQWEYAARGGRKSRSYKYSGSNDVRDVAWHGKDSAGESHPVAIIRANELGIYDMSGNVSEWCNDWYGKYISGSQTNPTGSYSSSCRVYRGGSWFSSPGQCRVSSRLGIKPDSRSDTLGLRLAL